MSLKSTVLLSAILVTVSGMKKRHGDVTSRRWQRDLTSKQHQGQECKPRAKESATEPAPASRRVRKKLPLGCATREDVLALGCFRRNKFMKMAMRQALKSSERKEEFIKVMACIHGHGRQSVDALKNYGDTCEIERADTKSWRKAVFVSKDDNGVITVELNDPVSTTENVATLSRSGATGVLTFPATKRLTVPAEHIRGEGDLWYLFYKLQYPTHTTKSKLPKNLEAARASLKLLKDNASDVRQGCIECLETVIAELVAVQPELDGRRRLAAFATPLEKLLHEIQKQQ